MSTYYETKTTLVRYKGEVREVWREDNDDGYYPQRVGDRRARQIAERHWLRKKSEGFCSGGYGGTRITIRMPGQNPKNLKKPMSWSA